MSDFPGAVDTFRTIENIPGQSYDPTKKTTIYAEDIQALAAAVVAIENTLGANLSNVYPIGSLYFNAVDDTDPATLLGFGTWVAFGQGRVIVGQNSSDSDFDTLGETGGEKEHTLTADESGVPQHTHPSATVSVKAEGSSLSGFRPVAYGSTIGTMSGDTTIAGNNTAADADEAHNNLQPYIVVKIWERTA